MNSRVFRVILFFSLFGLLFWSCENSSNSSFVHIEGELPIDSVMEVRVLNYMRGNELYRDTIRGRQFDLRIDSLPMGMYHLVFSWDRHVVSSYEMKSRSRYDEQGTPTYQISKNIWVSHKGKKHFLIGYADVQEQQELEDLWIDRESFMAIDIVPSDEESKVYEEWVQISQRYYAENLRQKDSLRQVMYACVSHGDLDGARSIHDRLARRWLADVEQAMKEEEISYLKAYNQHPMIPYGLYGRIASKADFEVYREIYEGMAPKVREQVNPVFERYMD